MLTVYPACIYKEESGYSIVFPDLNYLATCGDTLEEALESGIDCLAGYVYSARMEGEELPEASDLQDVDPKEVLREIGSKSGEGYVNMITVDVDSYAKEHFEKSVKKTLTIPSWLNEAAISQNINFSAVLQDALKERLGLHH